MLTLSGLAASPGLHFADRRNELLPGPFQMARIEIDRDLLRNI